MYLIHTMAPGLFVGGIKYVCCWNSLSMGVNCGSDTRQSDICECDMGGKVTKWVSLGGVKFVAVIVEGVSLVGGLLVGTSMVGVSLVGVSLVGVLLVGTSMVGVSLVGVSLVGVSLGRSVTEGVYMY